MKPTSKEVIDELCKILNATPKEKVKKNIKKYYDRATDSSQAH